jgi:glycosyltransferase 2 family protein
MRFNWKVIVGLLISVASVVYALSHVDFAQVADAFAGASYIWTIPMMLSVIITMWVRALRWQKLLLPVRKLGYGTLYSSVMIGFMANNLLPARVGEVIRALSLSQKHQLSKTSVFATIVAERAFDSLGLLTAFMITLIFIDYPGELKKAGLLILLISLLALGFLLLLRTKTDFAVKMICAPIGSLSKIVAAKTESILRKFAVGLTILTDPRLILIVYLQSIFLWVFAGISGYLIFLSFNLHPQVWAAFIVLFATALGVSLPSSPGYIGIYHAACIIAFDLINSFGMFGQGVSKSVALSYSIILWSCQFFPVTIIGLYYLKKEHLRFKDISRGELQA